MIAHSQAVTTRSGTCGPSHSVRLSLAGLAGVASAGAGAWNVSGVASSGTERRKPRRSPSLAAAARIRPAAGVSGSRTTRTAGEGGMLPDGATGGFAPGLMGGNAAGNELEGARPGRFPKTFPHPGRMQTAPAFARPPQSCKRLAQSGCGALNFAFQEPLAERTPQIGAQGGRPLLDCTDHGSAPGSVRHRRDYPSDEDGQGFRQLLEAGFPRLTPQLGEESHDGSPRPLRESRVGLLEFLSRYVSRRFPRAIEKTHGRTVTLAPT